MKKRNAQDRMIPLTDTGWQKYKPEGVKDLEFLAQENVPVYVQVNPARHLVYCYLQAGLASPRQSDGVDALGPDNAVTELADVETFPAKRFCNDVLYLQLSNKSYEQAAHSRRAVEPTFSGGGLSRRRIYTVTGRDRRGRQIRQYSNVKIHDLERVEFDRAILIDALLWNDALEYRRDQMLRGKGDPGMGPPEAFAVSLEKITEADLYLDAEDVERLKAQVLEREGHGNYPFDHKERMPGIYLMFQAAWLLNEKREAIDPKKWLASEGAKLGFKFRDKSIATAAKFAKLDLDRALGSGARGPLQTSGLPSWDDGAKYTFPFSSGWLSFVFALADWWDVQSGTLAPPPLVDLAKKLLQANFAGHEVGHLTLLISGKPLEATDVPELQSFVRTLRKRWRPVVGVDKRRKKARELGS